MALISRIGRPSARPVAVEDQRVPPLRPARDEHHLVALVELLRHAEEVVVGEPVDVPDLERAVEDEPAGHVPPGDLPPRPAHGHLVVDVGLGVLGFAPLLLGAVGAEDDLRPLRRRVQHLALGGQVDRVGLGDRLADLLEVDLRVALHQRLGVVVAVLDLQGRVQPLVRRGEVPREADLLARQAEPRRLHALEAHEVDRGVASRGVGQVELSERRHLASPR